MEGKITALFLIGISGLVLMAVVLGVVFFAPPPIIPEPPITPPGPPVSCDPEWVCSGWSACTNGKQVRTCTDGNACNTVEGRPTLIQDCVPITPICGNTICDAGESCQSCAQDCGTCAPNFVCGDNFCSNSESCSTCPQDCGTCAPVCGNSVCESTETCTTCSADCGQCACIENWFCSDWGPCTNGTQTRSCTDLNECGTTQNEPGTQQACTPNPFCGDNVCNGTESCDTCSLDCGICQTFSSKGSENGKRFWMAPNKLYEGRRDLGKFIFNADAGWDEVKGFLHTFKFYIGQINNLNEGELEIIVPVLFSNQIEAAFEVGGLRDPLCDGSQQAAIDIGILDRFVAVGGIIHYIDMDGPFSDSVMDPCGFDITRASSETVEYMQAMRARYPGVKIGLTIAAPHYSVGPYPSSTWKDSGDLLAQLDVFLQVVQDNGEQLDFYQSETRFDRPPWVDDWRKYVLIQEYFRDKGIRFGIYYGSAEGGHTSNQAFYENTLRDLVDFKAAGGDPDDIAISSYFPLPDDLYPETDAYSMTNTTRDFYRLYHQLYDNDG